MRVKRGVTARAKHKKVLKAALSGIELDRKILSELASREPKAFEAIVKSAIN